MLLTNVAKQCVLLATLTLHCLLY